MATPSFVQAKNANPATGVASAALAYTSNTTSNSCLIAFGFASSGGTITGTNGWTKRADGPTSGNGSAGLVDISAVAVSNYTPTATVAPSSQIDFFTLGLIGSGSNFGTSSASWLTVAEANSLRGVKH